METTEANVGLEANPPGIAPASSGTSALTNSARMEPDLDFIDTMSGQAGTTFLKCFQCGTCAATCELSPDSSPFPRKEMAWARWGLKEPLFKDPDVWLCHQCNDCSTRCPRDARPGDVLAAVRRECILHYSTPRFFAKWIRQPVYIPFLLAIPAVLLGLALTLRDPIAHAVGISRYQSDKISYSFSSELPHWLLNGFFGFFTLIVALILLVGVLRFWRAMKTTVPPERFASPARGLGSSIVVTIRGIFTHERFSQCGAARGRRSSHMLVLFGFLALLAVTGWVITSRYNPLLARGFIYPFGLWSPWKMLANLGGLAIVGGCYLMIRDRLRQRKEAVGSTYFDWAFILLLLFVVLSGFGSEIMHFARMEPHRHTMYFIHLVFAFALLIYVPYSKLAHVFYRTTAIVFAEHTGRDNAPSNLPGKTEDDAAEEIP